MTLRYFLSKYNDLAHELRCNSCSNSLVHCGEYEIVKVGLNEEGILCETCKIHKRNIESVTRISKNNDKQIFQVPISAVVQDIPFNNINNKVKDNDKNEEHVPHNSLNSSDKENQEEQEKV
jgi:hypothetical protein